MLQCLTVRRELECCSFHVLAKSAWRSILHPKIPRHSLYKHYTSDGSSLDINAKTGAHKKSKLKISGNGRGGKEAEKED